MLGGLFLALSMTAAIALVVDVVFSATTAIVCTAFIGALFALLWGILLIVRVLHKEE